LLAVIVVNLLLVGWFHGRTYPRTVLGAAHIGNRSFSSVMAQAGHGSNLPAIITLTDGAAHRTSPVGDLGVRTDASRTERSLHQQRSWLPLLAIFTQHRIALPIGVDAGALELAANTMAPTFHQDAVAAKVVKTGEQFTAAAPKDGHQLDKLRLRSAVLYTLDHNQATVRVPTSRIAPAVSLTEARHTAAKLQDSLGTQLTFASGSARQTPSRADIASWYAPNGDSYSLDDFLVRSAIAAQGLKMGIHTGNLSDAVAKTKQAVSSQSKATISLAPFTQTKTLHYCISSRGNMSAATLDEVKAKLANTYADLRGWSLDGQVIYVYADSDCDFTVWVSTPDQMTSFSAVCDSYWNCEAGGNVVINLDRWQQGTPAWHAAGGSMDDYRVMLINH
jgi:hypothetical protein